MQKFIQILPFWFIITIPVQSIFAYQLSFDGEYRYRFEIWDGLNKKTYGDQSLNSKGQKMGNADATRFGFRY